jgi:hypothetical protein
MDLCTSFKMATTLSPDAGSRVNASRGQPEQSQTYSYPNGVSRHKSECTSTISLHAADAINFVGDEKGFVTRSLIENESTCGLHDLGIGFGRRQPIRMTKRELENQ